MRAAGRGRDRRPRGDERAEGDREGEKGVASGPGAGLHAGALSLKGMPIRGADRAAIMRAAGATVKGVSTGRNAAAALDPAVVWGTVKRGKRAIDERLDVDLIR
jgi:hypothetical protein